MTDLKDIQHAQDYVDLQMERKVCEAFDVIHTHLEDIAGWKPSEVARMLEKWDMGNLYARWWTEGSG